jgi:hypothetical protein
MDWYWNLAKLLEPTEARTKALGDQLKQHIEDLYKKLLLYQMKSVCSLYRGSITTILRNTIKLDDWASALQSVKDAEKDVQQDIDTFTNIEIKMFLNTISGQARDHQTKLQNIYLAIQENTQKQEDRQQDEQTRRCLADLLLIDPRVHKERLADTKGGLFHGASDWIFRHSRFLRWRHADNARLLWVKADPGKGKTMLLITIIEELEQETRNAPSTALSYFFCQSTDLELNNAAAVLRGLIYQLCEQQPLLASHLRARYDHAGAKLFQDANSFYALSKVLENMIQDERLQRAYLAVDALDECIADRDQLLRYIARHRVPSPCVKWIVSSRNIPEIEDILEMSASDDSDDSSGSEVKLSLEVTQNAEQVTRAVEAFIDHKLSNMRSLRHDHKTRGLVRDIMQKKANGTFLWVALVAEELKKANSWRVLEVVENMPATLEKFYDHMMMDRARQSNESEWESCRLVLSAATLAYRPLRLAEMAIVSRLPAEIADYTNRVREVVALCGSFLTVKENEAKESVIYLIHQSVKDYLSGKMGSTIFPAGSGQVHRTMFTQSVQALSTGSTRLRRNIYDLSSCGVRIDDVKVPELNPLASIQYSCVHWAHHFCDASSGNSGFENEDLEKIDQFIRSFFLYWLEAVALLRSMPESIVLLRRLETSLKVKNVELLNFY